MNFLRTNTAELGIVRKMALSKDMTIEELIINKVCTKPYLIDVILTLLGLSDGRPIDIAKFFDENDATPQIPDALYDIFNVEELDNLAKINLNYQKQTVKSKWTFRSNKEVKPTGDIETDKINALFAATLGDEEFHFYQENQETYTNAIQKMIDAIIPYKDNASLIPITILIPDSNTQEGNELTGKETHWQFFNIDHKNNEDGKNGLDRVMRDKGNLFGLRLLLVFKLLGMVKLKQDTNNLSLIFSDILSSLPLNNLIKKISKEAIEKYKESSSDLSIIDKNIKELDRVLKKFHKDKTTLTARLDKASMSKNKYVKKISKTKSSLHDIEIDIKNKNSSRILAIKQKKSINVKMIDALSGSIQPSGSFYYSLNSGDRMILPLLTSTLKTQKFETNKVEYTQREVSQSHTNVESIRFALSRLLPYTSGTAITLHIPQTTLDQKVNSPLLILPPQWNDFLLSLKQYNYEEDKIKVKATKKDVRSNRADTINYHINDAKNAYEQPPKYARFFPRIHSSAIDHTVRQSTKSISDAMNKKYPADPNEPITITDGKVVPPTKK